MRRPVQGTMRCGLADLQRAVIARQLHHVCERMRVWHLPAGQQCDRTAHLLANAHAASRFPRFGYPTSLRQLLMKSISEREDNRDGGYSGCGRDAAASVGCVGRRMDLLGMGGREQPNPSREFELACAWFAHLHSIGWVANGDQ